MSHELSAEDKVRQDAYVASQRRKNALNEYVPRLAQLGRNGRWGTCVDCPTTGDNKTVLPELCINTARYDHHLTMTDLAESWNRNEHLKR